MADIQELIVALKLRDGVSAGLGRLNTQLKGMQTGMSSVGRGVGQVGAGLSTLTTRAGIAAAGLGTFAITTAASFEQAFTGVEKTVDGTDAQLAELEETLRQMARTIPVSFEELAAIGEAGGALGIARESLDEFVDVVARLAVSTDLTSEQAATSLGQLGNVLHLTGDDFEDFADSLVALGNAGASTESQIVEMAARFGAAGNSAGLSKEEILALSSAVASMGIEVEAGGTALSQTFNGIATAIGTGSDEVTAFTELMGISADEFKERWSKDALGTFQDFLTELSKLDQFEQSAVLEDAGITGVRQQNAVKLMTQNLGFFADQLEVAENAQGALDKESGKFFDTAQSQWKVLVNNVRDAATTIGTEMLPVTKEILEDLTKTLSDPANQKKLKEFGQNLAEGIRDFVEEIKKADFRPLLDTLKGAAAIAKGAFDAFRSLPAPIQQLAIAALVANKATGGAVGQIAGGLGSILKGVFQIAFGRGETPLRPMYTKEVGLGGVGGGLAGRGAAGGGGIAGTLLKGAGVLMAFEFGQWLRQNGPDLFPATPKRAPGTEPLGTKQVDGTSSDTVLLREFGGKLDKLSTEETLQHLDRTSEVGLEGVGTTIEQGLTNGLDPVGDTMTAILKRAEDPKAPEVMTEINGHIAALEEIQATYLETGDVKLAAEVQENIDTLHELIGTTDTSRAAIVGALATEVGKAVTAIFGVDGKLLNTNSKLDSTNSRISGLDPKITAVSSKIDTSNVYLAGINAKNFNPPAPKVIVQNFVTVSATVIQQQIATIRTLSGSGGFI